MTPPETERDSRFPQRYVFSVALVPSIVVFDPFETADFPITMTFVSVFVDARVSAPRNTLFATVVAALVPSDR